VTLKVESAMTNGRELRDQEHQEMLRKIVELQRRVALLEAKKAGNETISKLDEVIHQPEESARGRQPVDDLPRNHPFFGFARGAEVAAIYRRIHQKRSISDTVKKRGNSDLWSLILEALDAGLLYPNDVNTTKARPLMLRSIFPWLPKCDPDWMHFHLSDSRTRKLIHDEILPLAIANKDEVMRHPKRLKELFDRERKRRQQAELAEKSLALLKPGEFRVIMYGEQLWPRLNEKIGVYDYEQLGIAVATFRDLVNRFHGDSNSIAIHIRDSIKWLRFYVTKTLGHTNDNCLKIRRVFQLITHLSLLLGNNPEGECRLPPTPVIEEQ
jgi:hypothetical protein